MLPGLKELLELSPTFCKMYQKAKAEAEDDALLFHYTTAGGLDGILGSGYLYASDSRFLNDKLESQLVNYQSSLNGLRKKYPVPGNFRQGHFEDVETVWLQNYNSLEGFLRTSIALALGDLDKATTFEKSVFVTSFSADDDSLPQWRTYSQGGGYAMGLKKSHLLHLAELQGFELAPCVYGDEEAFARIAEELFENTLQAVLSNRILGDVNFVDRFERLKGIMGETVTHHDTPEIVDESYPIRKTLENCVQYLRAFTKHKSFESEAEWRIAKIGRTVDKSNSYRPTTSTFIPLVPFHLKQNSTTAKIPILKGPNPKNLHQELPEQIELRRVRIGPTEIKELVGLGLKNVLSTANYNFHENYSNYVEICFSESPYRSSSV